MMIKCLKSWLTTLSNYLENKEKFKTNYNIFKKKEFKDFQILNNETLDIGLDIIISTSNEWEDWELALKNMEGMATAMAAGIELYKELSERW